MHCRPSAHLGESLDKIPLVQDSPSFLSSWHLPPSNTWTKQKRPDLHWLSSSHGESARPVRSEIQKTFNTIKKSENINYNHVWGKIRGDVSNWLACSRLNQEVSQSGQSPPLASLGKILCSPPPKYMHVLTIHGYIMSIKVPEGVKVCMCL